MKKMLIVGGAGYIGGYVTDVFEDKQGFEVTVYDNLLYESHYLKEESQVIFAHTNHLYQKDDMVTYMSRDSSMKSLTPIDDMSLEIVSHSIPQAEKDVVDMLFLDCLVSNRDRHGFNWDFAMKESGEVIGLAPLFDHGNSLWSDYLKDFDFCMVPLAPNVDLTHYAMFESITDNYPSQIENLLNKCADIKLNDYVKPRYEKMVEIFERVYARSISSKQMGAIKQPCIENKPSEKLSLQDRLSSAKNRVDQHNAQLDKTKTQPSREAHDR